MGRRIDGVDLSHYQKQKIDYTKAKKAGVRFIYHKATEGTTWADPNYVQRRREAHAAGIPFGAYHFAQPKVGTAKAEALHFLSVAKPLPGDMIPALDLEVNPHHMTTAQLTTWVRTFLEVVAAHIHTHKALVYTHYPLNSVPSGVRLWASRYSHSNALPVIPKPFKTWSVWQFSDGRYGVPNSVPGIGHVDIDTIHQYYPFARRDALRIPHPKAPSKKNVLGEQAIYRFSHQGRGAVGYCLSRVVDAYRFPHGTPDAITAWNRAQHKHHVTDPKAIPRGYPIFWRGGSSGHGHIAISLGDGYCLSTDIKRNGYVSRVPISYIHQKWGLTLLGYTTDLNGKDIR